ncbi:UNVERIFIED_CONTAM: protein -I, chloroplastic [Sesamum angustifolium]|uniref:Protein TIC 20 n=1 Tax=Sesamum angustifolium TaxID=2727405 RepID=A0AAW2NJY0_9LAMI
MAGIQHFRLSAASTSLLHGEQGSLLHMIPKLPKRRRLPLPPRASKDVPYTFRFPAMTKKPRWWWRTLACLPYLMPLHETWMYAQTAYNLHPFLEDFEFLTYRFLGALGRLPSWSLMAYFFVAYLGVVRRKEWPHFFRFHVVMGMLLEIALQVIGTVSRWMPLGLYWERSGCTLGPLLHLPICSQFWSVSGVPLLGCMLMFHSCLMRLISKFHMIKEVS